MEIVWFILVASMVAIYGALDGFDFGVGIIYPFAARDERERAAVRSAIGPVWGVNEVWLIALGGVLFFAFPKAYAASFSGFYLAFILLLWCLIGRGLSLELRHELDHPVWRGFSDFIFPVASILLALIFGTALGNLLRGVSLNAEGHVFLPLWTDLRISTGPAIFDWYTLLIGLAALAALALHGANYLALRTEGDLYRRATRLGERVHGVAAAVAVAAVVLTPVVNRALTKNFAAYPAGYLLLVLAAAALAGGWVYRRRGADLAAFACSGLFILAMLATAAFGLFPYLLFSTTQPEHSLTIYEASTTSYGLGVGLVWFSIGMVLVGVYTFYLYRRLGRKVELTEPGY